MKFRTLILTLTSALLITFSFSCNKDEVSSPLTKSNEEILLSTPWKLQHIRGVNANQIINYKRGSNGNTENLDNESILFKQDKTGVYTANNGNQHPFTWEFTNAEKSQIVWQVNFTPAVSITWDVYEFEENSLKYSEYFTQGQNNIHNNATRIPK